MLNKSQIRADLLSKRTALSSTDHETWNRKIIHNIKASAIWKKAKHIGIYYPFNNEVDLLGLKTTNKSLYLPSIHNHSMQFHLWTDKLKLEKHKFGIRQPIFIDHLIQPGLDLCLMPLLGFDTQGNRLGLGAGFYDRYFTNNSKTILTGVAFSFQQLDQFPTDPWDVTLPWLFPEKGI
ncbi:MAG: 5-formyltetrahydrofolate cyclo-ligase, partial [Proteobacteria bacterium]|nr:5-formyltetrahydrofolate cyclo-ligase [Pseudomonadota bacterium]